MQIRTGPLLLQRTRSRFLPLAAALASVALPARTAAQTQSSAASFRSKCGEAQSPCCFCLSAVGVVGGGTCDAAARLCWKNVSGENRRNPTSARGTATLQAWGREVEVAWTSDPTRRFAGSGTWRGSATGWKTLPGAGRAEYRVTAPALSVSVRGAPASASAALAPGRFELRAPDAGVSAGSDPGSLSVDADGFVSVPLPRLPAPAPVAVPSLCNAACSELAAAAFPADAVRFDGNIATVPASFGPLGSLD